MPGKAYSQYLSRLLYFFYIIFLASIICSWNSVSSISIGLICVAGIIKNKIEKGSFFSRSMFNSFFIGCLLFYIFQCAALLYTENTQEGLKHLQLKSALVFVPLALYCCDFIDNSIFKKLMRYFIGVLFGATIYCLVNSLQSYIESNDLSVFFYHRLVSSLSQHAIQFSILVFIALIHLLEEARKGNYHYHAGIHFGAIVYFVLFLLMLSSKLIIAFFILYLVYYFILTVKRLTGNRFIIPISALVSVTVLSLILFTRNPVSYRFNEIIAGKIELIREEKFNPGIYFNGLQFRLLEWRFVREILIENNAWLLGLGPGDGQQALDQKYISTNMYIGESARGDRGFLGYNTHNQFFESALQTGIIGLFAFGMICFGMVKMAWSSKKNEVSAIVILLLAYACNESVFETQYGLMIFLFFPVFLFQGHKQPVNAV